VEFSDRGGASRIVNQLFDRRAPIHRDTVVSEYSDAELRANSDCPVGPAIEPADLLSSGSSRPESSAGRLPGTFDLHREVKAGALT